MQRFNREISRAAEHTNPARPFKRICSLHSNTQHLSFHEVTTPDLYLQANRLTHTPSRSVLNTQIVMVRAFRQCTGCNDSYSVSAAEESGHSPGTSQNIALVFLRFFLLLIINKIDFKVHEVHDCRGLDSHQHCINSVMPQFGVNLP